MLHVVVYLHKDSRYTVLNPKKIFQSMIVTFRSHHKNRKLCLGVLFGEEKHM